MNDMASRLITVYVQQLFINAKAVSDGCDFVFNAAPIPTSGGYIKVSPELHARIDSVLIGAANVKKLISVPSRHAMKETDRAFAFRKERATLLLRALGDLTLVSMLDVKVRDSHEHFDEHLDRLASELDAEQPPPAPVASYNMAFSSAAVARIHSPHYYPLRVYIADERAYYNFEERIDLGLLSLEARALLARIASSATLENVTEAGGMMIVFPSFSGRTYSER